MPPTCIRDQVGGIYCSETIPAASFRRTIANGKSRDGTSGGKRPIRDDRGQARIVCFFKSFMPQGER